MSIETPDDSPSRMIPKFEELLQPPALQLSLFRRQIYQLNRPGQEKWSKGFL